MDEKPHLTVYVRNKWLSVNGILSREVTKKGKSVRYCFLETSEEVKRYCSMEWSHIFLETRRNLNFWKASVSLPHSCVKVSVLAPSSVVPLLISPTPGGAGLRVGSRRKTGEQVAFAGPPLGNETFFSSWAHWTGKMYIIHVFLFLYIHSSFLESAVEAVIASETFKTVTVFYFHLLSTKRVKKMISFIAACSISSRGWSSTNCFPS